MDILLHIIGLAFIPILIYILFLGIQDIISVWLEHNPQYSKQRTPNKKFPFHIVKSINVSFDYQGSFPWFAASKISIS